MLRTGIAFLVGMLIAGYSPLLIDRWWVSFLPLLLFIGLFDQYYRLPVALLCGILWTTLAIYWQLDHRLPQSLNNKRLEMVVEVINIPRHTHRSSKFLIHPLQFPTTDKHLPDRIQISWRDAPEDIRPGQRWRLLIKLRQTHGYQNPGAFDYERWLFYRGIQARGYVVKSPHNQMLEDSRFNLNALRMNIIEHLNRLCAGCRHGGLIQALASGYRGHISRSTRRLLQQTGTAHLIAVSGLHIGIIAGVFYWLSLHLWRWTKWFQHLPQKDFAMFAAWLGGLIYSLLSGFELPAQRAMMMLSVLLLTMLLRLPINLLQSTLLAVLAVLMFSPLAILSSSFWLTFNALLIIVLATLFLHKSDHWLKKLLIIQALFSVFYVPISLVVFQQIHPASFAANLFAVPWVSLLIVPFNFLLLLLGWLPDPLLQGLYQALDWLLDILVNYLDLLQQWGMQAISWPAISVWWLFLYLFAAVLLLQPGKLLSRRLLLLGMPLVVFYHPPVPPPLRMTVLDVGMGTSIVVQTRHHALVYDFGPGNRYGYSLGEWAVIPFLQRAGVTNPDRIVLSHGNQDHIGGFYALQRRFAVVPVFAGMVQDIAAKMPAIVNLQDCHQAPGWRWDGVDFRFLQTAHLPSDSDNNRSCVLRIQVGDKALLLTGDIEKTQERRLLQQYSDRLAADILVAPHHGSLTSSTAEFIEAVGARHVIFTSGFLNRWGFPRPPILQRYRQRGAELHNTAQAGAVMSECDERHCKVTDYRRRYPRIWY